MGIETQANLCFGVEAERPLSRNGGGGGSGVEVEGVGLNEEVSGRRNELEPALPASEALRRSAIAATMASRSRRSPARC